MHKIDNLLKLNVCFCLSPPVFSILWESGNLFSCLVFIKCWVGVHKAGINQSCLGDDHIWHSFSSFSLGGIGVMWNPQVVVNQALGGDQTPEKD